MYGRNLNVIGWIFFFVLDVAYAVDSTNGPTKKYVFLFRERLTSRIRVGSWLNLFLAFSSRKRWVMWRNTVGKIVVREDARRIKGVFLGVESLLDDRRFLGNSRKDAGLSSGAVKVRHGEVHRQISASWDTRYVCTPESAHRVLGFVMGRRIVDVVTTNPTAEFRKSALQDQTRSSKPRKWT